MLVGLWRTAPGTAISSEGRPPGPPRARCGTCTGRFPALTGTTFGSSPQIMFGRRWPPSPGTAISSGGDPPDPHEPGAAPALAAFRPSPVLLLGLRRSSCSLAAVHPRPAPPSHPPATPPTPTPPVPHPLP